nr:hypothetical protein [Aliamphritea spongicola]
MMAVQICRGLFGNLGADQLARAERLAAKAEERFQQARAAIEEGSINGEILMNSAQSFQAGALKAEQAAAAAAAEGIGITIVGLVLLVAIKILQGSLANWLLEQRFMQWRADRSIRCGLSAMSASMGALIMALVYPLAAYRFTAAEPPQWLLLFPADRSWHSGLANWVDSLFGWLTLNGEGLFDGIRDAIRILLDATEVVLVDTPWPIVMLVIVVLAWRLAGPGSPCSPSARWPIWPCSASGKKHGNRCPAGHRQLHLCVIRRAVRHLVCQERAGLCHRAADSRLHANHACIRLSDSGYRLLRHR